MLSHQSASTLNLFYNVFFIIFEVTWNYIGILFYPTQYICKLHRGPWLKCCQNLLSLIWKSFCNPSHILQFWLALHRCELCSSVVIKIKICRWFHFFCFVSFFYEFLTRKMWIHLYFVVVILFLGIFGYWAFSCFIEWTVI